MIYSICLIFNRKCFVKTLETEHLSSLCDNWIIVIWTSVSSRLSIRVTVGNIFKSVIFLQPASSPACSSPVVEISPPRLYSLFLYLNITALHWSVSQIPPRDVVGGGGGGGGGRPAVSATVRLLLTHRTVFFLSLDKSARLSTSQASHLTESERKQEIFYWKPRERFLLWAANNYFYGW